MALKCELESLRNYVIYSKKLFIYSSMKPLHIDRISAVFSWNRRQRYEFVVKSQNAKGESANNSIIVIPPLPSHYEGSTSPEWIKNEYDPTKHTYSLSWSPPKYQEGLIDYTVFWCQSKKATPNECEVCVAQNYTNIFVMLRYTMLRNRVTQYMNI